MKQRSDSDGYDAAQARGCIARVRLEKDDAKVEDIVLAFVYHVKRLSDRRLKHKLSADMAEMLKTEQPIRHHRDRLLGPVDLDWPALTEEG